MSETLDVAQWAKNWEAMARQAQATISGAAGQSPWASTAGNPAWADALGKAHPFADGKPQNEAMERLLSGAQGYLGMMQSLAAAAAGQQGAGAEGWAGMLRNGFFPGAFPTAVMNNPVAAAVQGFGGHGARSFEQMMEQFAAAAGPMFDKTRGAMRQPAFGFMREKQENLQKIAQVFVDYQEQSARYDRLMLKVGERSFARFQLKLAEREEPGRQIDSMRALYDLWIDAAEEAYAEIALSEEFREVYGAVVDAQMRVRQQVQGEIEKFCGELGVPTRTEVDSIGQRLQALRREFRSEREGGSGLDDLKAEVEALRSEVAALKGADSGPATPAARKVSRKGPKAARQKAARVAESASKALPPRAKARRKPADMATAKRRPKRGRSGSVASGTPLGKVARAMAQDGKSAPKGNSFAASIARFARKSKSSAATRPIRSLKAGAGKRGGDK